MSSSTKEQTEQEFVHEVQFFIGFCKSKITVEYLQKQANKATTKILDAATMQKEAISLISKNIHFLASIVNHSPQYIPMRQHKMVADAFKVTWTNAKVSTNYDASGNMGQRVNKYLLELYDILLWRLARGALNEQWYVHGIRLANLLITGYQLATEAPSSSQPKRDRYESLGWRLRAVAACGAGDYAQVNHCCNQVVKYGDADYEDVSNAEKYADELMDSLLARRKETSLQDQVSYEVSRVVRQIHTQLSKLIDCASLNSGSEPISDEPLYETLVSTIKLKYPETTLEGDEKHNPFTIEDLIREFESIKNSDIQLTHALSPLFCLLHEAMHFMQQKLFHSALCEFLACITVCGACLSIKMHSIGTKEGNDDTKGALRGVLLISLANASACSARLKIVWDLPGTTSTSTLFPHNPSVLHETGAVDMQGREQQISSGFFQSKAVVKSSHTNDVESNSSVHIDEPSESILSQSQKLLTISNLTSSLPNSPEYLCDLAISLVESYVSINDSYPNPIPSSVTSVLSLDLLVLHWRKIEVLTLLKRHSSVVRALESFETMITSFSTHSVSSTLCSFDLTRRSASDLWSSCLDVRRRFDDTDTDTDTDTNSDSVFDKLQPIDFTFREVELNGESIITSSESTKLLLQSFMVEAGKEKTRALNRLRRFGPTG